MSIKRMKKPLKLILDLVLELLIVTSKILVMALSWMIISWVTNFKRMMRGFP
jgi:hypothetical protein